MYNLYDYESQRQRHTELLNEAKRERMIRVYKKSLKPSRNLKPGYHFLKGFSNLFFHRVNRKNRSSIHRRHSIEV